MRLRPILSWLAAAGGLAVLATGLAWRSAAPAAEPRLLMFELPDCQPCIQFERDVGRIYDNTEEGRRAPIQRLPLDEPPPEDLALEADVEVAPTFVLIRDRRELGRITGYRDDEAFWLSLTRLLRELGNDTD
ncbi:thioredoxin family protein [Salinisphaera sp. P385]|uniref:Thioredoxin family protein n=1 Tax=Spectribacter acetivorans TaxID=3075603 RepID=A0ABU3B7F3_9GAMM|nr:thioredoxin family protein [Salinisphaera sp. P385]MDT0617762.1 thioredoxin family protein [Salinisphaera sp. P385]